jgi:formylglycine-generating enzyme required for sulfatase activity
MATKSFSLFAAGPPSLAPKLEPDRALMRPRFSFILFAPFEGRDEMGPTLSLPPLANWQDFERLCCDLWKRIWKGQHALLNGRGGQTQHGVDVYVLIDGGMRWAGVQCKRFEVTFKKKSQLEAEVAAARNFNPAISDFVIATTAPNNAKAQAWAREITEAQQKIGSFPVTIYGWGDICRELAPHQDLIQTYFPDFSWPPEKPAVLATGGPVDAVRHAYLANLFSQLERVTLGVFGKSSQRVETRLHEIFVSLDIEKQVGLARSKDPGGEPGDELSRALRPRLAAEEKALVKLKELERSPNSPYVRAAGALEALAVFPRLVLTGKAGSGKSTFGRFVALCLAGELLARPEADLDLLNRDRAAAAGAPLDHDLLAWRHGAPLPFFVELSRFVQSEYFPPAGEDGESHHLFDYLTEQDNGELRALLTPSLNQDNGALLVLDGLDETPAAGSVRNRLRQVIDGFARAWPRCRILVTSRPYAYDQEGWRLGGFINERLAPFDPAKRAAFVRAWMAHLAAHGEIDSQAVVTRGEGLIQTIEATPYLTSLADTPLMLTMIADLDTAHGGRLPPGGRTRLYEESVALLLDRWNQVRHGASVADLCGIDPVALRHALEKLAFEVHRSRGRENEGAATISEAELWKAVKGARQGRGKIDEQEVRDYLHQRSGILVAESPEVFRFPHRSYQEFLAACHLSRTRFPGLLIEEVRRDPALWREVFLLVIGRASESPFTAWAALEGLVPEAPESALDIEDSRFAYALCAALALEETGLWLKTEAQDRPKLERVRQWLQETARHGALLPDDRAAAGRMLGRLGDRRYGVGLGANGLPEIDFVEIEQGPFLMGSEKRRVVLENSFAIARYPITNAQFQAFVDDGGYGEHWQHCWSAEGWAWRSNNGIYGPEDDFPVDFLVGNHPQVGVSFFEASAFCRWLGEKLSLGIALPTEQQWERAARYVDGRTFPWGDEPDPSRMNIVNTGIWAPSAVGMFPSGASEEGVLDLAGNVWEWTASCPAAESSAEEAQDLAAAPTGTGVMRGGSCWNSANIARSSYRGYGELDQRLDIKSLRVALLAHTFKVE